MAMSGRPGEGTILALDNVPLDLPVAGAGTRALAALLDYLIVALLAALFTFVLIALAVTVRPSGGWILALILIGLFAIDTGYFAGVELATGGRSFGKWALGLRVVMQHGGRPGALALLVRNAVRSVDLIVGVPIMVADPLARRLGDRLAGTLVVHSEARADDVVLARVPRGWGAREVALVESFFRRASELEPARAEALARSLLASVERDDPALLAGLPLDEPVATLRRALGKGAA